MTSVSVQAWSHGDGYLTVDTREWIADRGEYAEDLTADLRAFLDENGHQHATDRALVEWIVVRTGESPSGLHGDGMMWVHQLCNFADHLLDDFGFVVLTAAEIGAVMIVVSDDTGRYVAPEVYRSTGMELEEWAEYSQAYGECVNAHRWFTADTVHLHATDGDQGTYRVPGQVRVPFGDRDRGYVACPECGKALRFSCP